jgi:hypothetical protein
VREPKVAIFRVEGKQMGEQLRTFVNSRVSAFRPMDILGSFAIDTFLRRLTRGTAA